MSGDRLFPAAQTTGPVELDTQALPATAKGPRCAGCGQIFRPARTSQRHCRPGCRVTAFRKRRPLLSKGNQKSDFIQNKKAADSSQESAADSRRRGNLPSRTSETS